jgi:hypothetical protein
MHQRHMCATNTSPALHAHDTQHTAIQLCRARGPERDRLEGKLRKHLRTKRHLVRHVQGPGGMHPATASADEVDSEEDTELDLSAILPMEQPAVRRMVQAFHSSSSSDAVGRLLVSDSEDMTDDIDDHEHSVVHGVESERSSRQRSYSSDQQQQQQQQHKRPHSRSLLFGAMVVQPSAAQQQQQQQQWLLQKQQQQQPLHRQAFQLFNYPTHSVSLHAPVVVQQQRSSGSIVGGGLATHTHQFPVSVASADALQQQQQQQQYYPSMLPGSAHHIRTVSSSSNSSACMRSMAFTECGNGAESPSSDDAHHFDEQKNSHSEQKDSHHRGESPWAAAVRSAEQRSASSATAAAAVAAVAAAQQQQQQQQQQHTSSSLDSKSQATVQVTEV